MDKHEKLLKRLLGRYADDESVLGAVLVGSVGKGYGDERSDLDLEVVVTENRYNLLVKKGQKFVHTNEYDLIFTTMNDLQKARESKKDEDHWWCKDCPVLLDKTGKLDDYLREIGSYDADSRLDRLKKYYIGYWENSLRAMACLRHENEWVGRIYTALAMRDLIRLLFNFNYRWAPKIQWVSKEIPSLEKKPVDLESRIERNLVKPDHQKLSTLWDETAELLREEGYTWVDRPEEIM